MQKQFFQSNERILSKENIGELLKKCIHKADTIFLPQQVGKDLVKIRKEKTLCQSVYAKDINIKRMRQAITNGEF